MITHAARSIETSSAPLASPTSWASRSTRAITIGVFLAGDMTAAPGCLSEIAWASGVEASRLAVAFGRGARSAGRGSQPAAVAR
ncbi:MAG: hypothetical protein ACR2IP_00125 [Solirubrobacteraceae bacterium]